MMTPKRKILKRKITELLLISLTALVCVSCGTSVALRTLVPAEIDVGGYKTIAVQSVRFDCPYQDPGMFVPIKGDYNPVYANNLSMFSHYSTIGARRGAEAAADMFVKAMDVGFFNIIPPTETDAMIVLGKSNGNVRDFLIGQGVDALVSISVSYANFDEFITSEAVRDSSTNVIKGYNFYLTQTAALVITYTVTDVKNNEIVAVRTLSNTDCPYMEKVKIGHTQPSSMAFVRDSAVCGQVQNVFEDIVVSFKPSVRSALSPNYITVYFNLAKNKPQIESLKRAYEFVDGGQYEMALEMFVREWEYSNHYPSGFNAAILYYALGDYDNAFRLAEEVYRKTGEMDAYGLYQRFRAVKDSEDAAVAQINASEDSRPQREELIGF